MSDVRKMAEEETHSNELSTSNLNEDQLELYQKLQERGKKVVEFQIIGGKGNNLSLGFKDRDKLTGAEQSLKLVETMGTFSAKAATLLLEQLAEVAHVDGNSFSKTNYAISLVHNIDPQNDIEAMLACQMVTTQILAMDCAKRANKAETMEAKKVNLTYANRLMNTFTNQVSTLDKHRGKGQQKMTVEHVYVGEGGQAIIGSVEKGGGEKNGR